MLFIALAVLSIGLFLFLFEMRYAWYADGSRVAMLRAVESLTCGLIIILWWLWPSRIATAVIGAGAFLVPPLYERNAFVSVDIAFAAFIAVVLALILAATHLRAKLRAGGRLSGEVT